MHRREAIKSLALASIAAMVMTRCDIGEQKVSDFLSKGKLNLDDKHKDYLAQISETFLPLHGKVDKITPPEEFIMTMVNDCSSEEDIEKFARGFNDYKNLMNTSKLQIETDNPEEVISIVHGVLDKQESEQSQEDLLYFINTVRGQSLRNLTTSAYYMQDYMDYELIPSEYIPCYDISTIKA